MKRAAGTTDNSCMGWMFLIMLAVFVVALLSVFFRAKGQFTFTVVAVKGLVEFARDLGPMTSEYLKVNWSGQSEDLHRALKPLLEKARALALERGITMDEDTLRNMVIQAVAHTRLVKRAQLVAAMDSIERPGAQAA